MRVKDRRSHIAQLLGRDGGVNVDELARLLNVTASTIRRDLTRLAVEGGIARTYGGAVSFANRAEEPPLHQRALQARAEKDAIGRWAANQIGEGETVILDAGSTVGRVAHHLRHRTGLTVITNGLTSVIELADSDIRVVALGGELRHISHGFVGPLTDMTLARLSADRAFLGADGLVADRGICEASTVQTCTKELMAARSRKVYVLADGSKIAQAPFDAWAPLEQPWTLVTDSTATSEQLEPFRRRPHIDVVVAG
jgi:DeoR/GlpR family transcriptional regulator of sugar metabolism